MNRRDALKSILAIPGVSQVQIAPILPNDVIVITCATRLSDETRKRIREHLQPNFPLQKILVLDQGLNLEIKRPTP